MEITQHLCLVFITQCKVGCLTKEITCGNFRSGNQVSSYTSVVTLCNKHIWRSRWMHLEQSLHKLYISANNKSTLSFFSNYLFKLTWFTCFKVWPFFVLQDVTPCHFILSRANSSAVDLQCPSICFMLSVVLYPLGVRVITP